MQRRFEVSLVDRDRAESLAQALGIPPLLASLLLVRKITDVEAARRFLSPSLHDLFDPFLMRDMDRAVARLLQALSAQEKVCIWGDYDVDGVTATSVLLLFLKQVGLTADYHIPTRMGEGYGLNAEAIGEIADRGTKLLVTVDCGISDVDQIAHAVQRGLDVIVIDHHQVGDQLPAATSILNPHRSDCDFPAKDLAAVGVVFNLVMALRAELRRRGLFRGREEPNLKEMLDLVALGTVADIVPLMGENRIVTHFGLQELSASRRPGVAALKEVAGLHGGAITAGQVAFRLAPRINAIGRLKEAARGVELLTTRSYSRALSLARELDQANAERQTIEQHIFDQALREAENAVARGEGQSLVLAEEGWHIGVIGIVASRLAERFSCPVVLIGLDGERGRGSARGVDGIHLYSAIAKAGEHLLGFGGHRLAAGLSIERGQVAAFRKAFSAAVQEQLGQTSLLRVRRADLVLRPNDCSIELCQSLARLQPYGLGNPEPAFVAEAVEVRAVRPVGRDGAQHLKVTVLDEGRAWDAIGFRMADRIGEFQGRLDLLYTPEVNTWEGQETLQLRLVDVRPAEGAPQH